MHKTCPTQIKAAGPDDGLKEGQFRALVSVFGNRDSYGDVVVPGAFTNTLADWEASGNAIPIYYSHQINDPEMNIGWVEHAEETDSGLEILGQLDLGEGAPPKAALVHRLLKRQGGPRDFSFAYDVIDGGPKKDADGNEFFELRELKLYEVGPTQVGANPATELLAVKSLADTAQAALDGVKAGRVLSAKNEATLRDALDALQGCATQIKNVLASVSGGEDDQEKAREVGQVKAEEPAGAKAEEPNQRTPAALLEQELNLIDMEGAFSWTT